MFDKRLHKENLPGYIKYDLKEIYEKLDETDLMYFLLNHRNYWMLESMNDVILFDDSFDKHKLALRSRIMLDFLCYYKDTLLQGNVFLYKLDKNTSKHYKILAQIYKEFKNIL